MASTPSAFKDITAALPNLSGDELAQVGALVSALRSMRTDVTPDLTKTMELVDMICKAVAKKTGGHTPMYVFRESNHFTPFKKRVENLESFFEKFGLTSKVERIALYTLLVNILIEDLVLKEIPVSVNTVANCIEQTPRLFAKQFPGYIENNYQSAVIRTLAQEGNPSVRREPSTEAGAQ
tara:strand:+ start:44 stop:583 length:540 start_codon:yes stop_codon:yes gene_type:complete